MLSYARPSVPRGVFTHANRPAYLTPTASRPFFVLPRPSRALRAPQVSRHARKEEGEARSAEIDVAEDDAAPVPTSTPVAQEETGEAATRMLAEAVANPLFYLVGGLVAIKLVASLGEQVGAIVLLSAAPVVGLTLISKSDAGKKVQEGLEARLPALQADAEALAAQQQAARDQSPWYGAGRPKWLGPLGDTYQYPAYLNGTVAGDYGFDPLGFSAEPAAFARNYECELLHARWAMLAAIGALIPEALAMSGVELGEPVWWKVGYAKLSGDLTLNYAGIEGFRIAGKQGLWVIAMCQLVLMGGPEYARYVGIKSLEPVGIFLPGNTNYPGSQLFDPLNFSSKPHELAKQAVMEIKNGRIAMLATLGYAVQAAVTRKGPVENLVDFIADPQHNNILANLSQ